MKRVLTVDRLSEIEESTEPLLLKTGMVELDAARYLRRESPHLIVVGGRPTSGKTLFALQIAYEVSFKVPALVFSLEMDKKELKARFRKNSDLDDENAELYICDLAGLHVDEICLSVTNEVADKGIGLVVVDYAQIVRAMGRTKAEEVGQVITKFKGLAKKLQIPIILLAQLNRDIEKRSAGAEFVEPQMSDLADSAELEKWADCCLILHRVPRTDGVVKVHCVKNRHGPNRDFELRLNRQSLRFEDNEKF